MERQLADNPNQRRFPGLTSCMQGIWDSLDKGIVTGRIRFLFKGEIRNSLRRLQLDLGSPSRARTRSTENPIWPFKPTVSLIW